MAGHARNPSQQEQIRRLQELVRRLGTRLPAATAATVEPWKSLAPHLNPKWTTDGVVTDWYHARYRRAGGQVSFAGLTTLNTAIAGPDALRLILSMPTGYVPDLDGNYVLFEDPDNGLGGYRHWVGDILPGSSLGLLRFENNGASGSSPPNGVCLFLDGLSYWHA